MVKLVAKRASDNVEVRVLTPSVQCIAKSLDATQGNGILAVKVDSTTG
jgi:hypothetical protein